MVKRKVLMRFERLYRDSPALFSEVPGASRFLEQLRSLDGVGIAVATGCWHAEALFKLRASGLSIDGLPIASSDDSRDRKEIMTMAVNKAEHTLGCIGFEHILYFGDGVWDLQVSRSLGYDFIGIGPRIQALQHTESIRWHPDYLEPRAVFASIAAAFLQP